MNVSSHLKNITTIALVLLVVVAVEAVGLFGFFLRESQMKPVVTCASFSTYADALQAYNAGNKKLDGGKRNGIPCENLL